MLLALVSAIVGYAIWYWLRFHQWCPAMWHGTAPPIIMLMIGGTVYRLANQIWPNDGGLDD
jgi:hypothetical protein